ncbi:MAG TPA: hypothetical protein VLO11_09095 [Luteolibacter sp.]|nr:hypothetical protein [Luteolibacter sp.]
MKFKGVRRSDQADPIERTAGDAPNLGSVGRTYRRLATRKRRRMRDSDRRTMRNATRNWTVVLVVLVLIGIAAGIGSWLMPMMDTANRVAGDKAGIELVPVEEKLVESRFPSPSMEEAFELVKAGIGNRDPEKALEYFRHGSASAGEIVAFMEYVGKTEGEATNYKWHSSIDANGLLLEAMTAVISMNGRESSPLAILTPDEEGRWKIDFESFARIVKPSWSALLEGETDQGMVRVLVAKDNYYNGVFRDESAWICYGMASQDTSEVLLGYCKAGSPQARAMEWIMAESEGRPEFRGLCRATLEIRRPAGAGISQYEITRVLAQDWVVSDKIFDSIFK